MRVKSSDARPRTAAAVPAGRPAQRRRTRKAIVDAAMALLARGMRPSVAEVAAAADVSRRTVYLYFPSFDQLLLDATAGALSQEAVTRALADEGSNGDVRDRIERLVRALHDVSPEVEHLGRELIRLSLAQGAPGASPDAPRRGYRRIEWIETALAPWRGRLTARRWRRLVNGLALVVGWEAMLVERDVCGLTIEEAADVSAWAARALIEAAWRDANQGHRRGT